MVYGIGKTASTGFPGTLSWSGTASAASNNLTFSLFGPPPNQPAILFSGPTAQSVPFMGGTLLVAPPITRDVHFATDVFGFAVVNLPVNPALVGTTRYYQCWFLDPNDPTGVGITNGVEVRFCN